MVGNCYYITYTIWQYHVTRQGCKVDNRQFSTKSHRFKGILRTLLNQLILSFLPPIPVSLIYIQVSRSIVIPSSIRGLI